MTSRPAAPTPETDAVEVLCKRLDSAYSTVLERSLAKKAAKMLRALNFLRETTGMLTRRAEIAEVAEQDLERALSELTRQHALAQTEIKGHMRTEDDLKRDIGIYQASIEKFAMQHQRKVMGLETRVAELERALARLGSMEAFKGPRFVTEHDTELIARIDFARAALKSRA